MVTDVREPVEALVAGPELAEAPAAGAPPLRILWFMLHAGYIRYYGPALRLLADRGHSVQLTFTRFEKDPGDERLARELAASHPNITCEEAPLRRRGDGWRPLATLVRSLVDVSRYVDPRYAEAPALRARMTRKLSDHVRTAQALDPLTRRLTLRLIRSLTARSSERLSRRTVAALGAVERAIPTSRRIDRFLRDRKPDVVLVTPIVEFASNQVEYVKSARKARVACAVGIASWDNLTGKGLIRVVPDRVFVWNEAQVQEAVDMHGVPRRRVIATGAPKFDEWFERAPQTSPAEFAAKVGLDPGRPYVLYACSSAFIAPGEVAFVERWLGALRAHRSSRLREIGVVVRPHPQNAEQWRGADLRRFADAVVWPPAGAQPDAGEARADFFDSLWHSAAVVGINTSALIEAAIVGKSVLAPLAPEFTGTQLGTLHFRHVLFENGGFVHVERSLEAHLDRLDHVLEHGDEHAGQTRRFVESFVRPHGIERAASPILADEIEALAASAPTAERRRPADHALRLVRAPLAVCAELVGSDAAAAVARRDRAEVD
jgi:hypothetical protein